MNEFESRYNGDIGSTVTFTDSDLDLLAAPGMPQERMHGAKRLLRPILLLTLLAGAGGSGLLLLTNRAGEPQAAEVEPTAGAVDAAGDGGEGGEPPAGEGTVVLTEEELQARISPAVDAELAEREAQA